MPDHLSLQANSLEIRSGMYPGMLNFSGSRSVGWGGHGNSSVKSFFEYHFQMYFQCFCVNSF